jgi:hypothetical protein
MKRRLFTVAAALSCLLAVGVAASWVRSYWVYDQVSCGSMQDGHQCAWESYGASSQFVRWPPGIPKGASGMVLTCFGKVLLEQAIYNEEPLRRTASRGYGWSSDDNVIPSFSYFYAVTGDMTREGYWTIRQGTVRHWALELLFAVLPVAWLFASGQRRVRHAPVPTQGAQ